MTALLVMLLLFGVLCYPYVQTEIQRRVMLRRLGTRVKKMGYRIRRKRYFGLFGNRSGQYDLFIGNNQRIWAVKLWSCYHAPASLLIDERGKVCEQIKIEEPLHVYPERGRYHRTFARSVSRTRLVLHKKETRAVTRVLLVYPAYRNILAKKQGTVTALKCGDRIFDKILHSPASLEQWLRQEAKVDFGTKAESSFEDRNKQNGKAKNVCQPPKSVKKGKN